MQMRLAFAVAAHLESEILIVDEVLAVGDAKFQSRCLDRMKNIAQTGRTVLFVSHSLDAISALTQTGLLLVRGGVAYKGRTTETIDRYLHPDVDAASDLNYFREVRSTPEVEIQRIRINRQDPPTTLKLDGEMELEITVSSTIAHPKPCVTLIFSDQLGRNIATLCSLDKRHSFALTAGQNTICVRVPHVSFAPGRYTLDVALNAYLTAPAWDLIRGYPVGEVIVGEEFDDTTLVYPHRTWGAMHIEGVTWDVGDKAGISEIKSTDELVLDLDLTALTPDRSPLAPVGGRAGS
jgi:lipopolysaccharide transport system ATP-binding protein